MSKTYIWSRTTWTSILLVAVFFVSFCVAFLPQAFHQQVYRVLFTVIYFAAVFSMDKHQKHILLYTGIVIVMEWVSAVLDVDYMLDISRVLTIGFFLFIVASLIKKIAKAKTVTARVILEAINGYLLIGIAYSVIVGLVARYYPGSYSFTESTAPGEPLVNNFSQNLYFGLITMATVGYGDFLPLKPESRSLATLIGISGQLYIAIIIAMLVGKYSAQGGPGSHKPPKQDD